MVDEHQDDRRGTENGESAWRRKKIEFVQKETSRILETRQMLKDWIRRSIDEYGNIPPKMRERVDNAGRDLGITVDEVIGEVMAEQVVGKSGKVDHEKLALLLLQKAQGLREKNGGIMTLAEMQLTLERESSLSGRIRPEDVKKAAESLSERELIPGFEKLRSGLTIVRFFPAETSLDQNTVLDIASEKGWTTLEEVMVRTSWSRERAEIALRELENSGISRPDPSYSTGKRWYFPGLTRQ